MMELLNFPKIRKYLKKHSIIYGQSLKIKLFIEKRFFKFKRTLDKLSKWLSGSIAMTFISDGHRFESRWRTFFQLF